MEINPPLTDAYQLKERLLFLYKSNQTSHILRLFKIPPLGSQLTQMRLLCPEYNQKGSLFRERCSTRGYLRRYLQSQLAEDDMSTVGELATRADKIAQC